MNTKEKFCGMVLQADKPIGNVYQVADGYIVREVIPFARKIGPVLFNGRRFSKADFKKLPSVNYGYAVEVRYELVIA